MSTASFCSCKNLIGSWRPTIGDPSFMGWFTVVSYFACAIVSLSAAIKCKKSDRGAFLFWNAISTLMFLLGVNKQLDLQSLLTEIGRQIARYQGWMDQRRIIQFWFIVILVIAVVLSFLIFVIVMRDLFRRFKFAFIGLFVLMSFIMIRAISFHHVDEMLRFRIFDVKMNWVFELTGIYTVFIAGMIDIFRLKNSEDKE